MQTPPQFSAIKIDGERAYDLAREGETVEIPEREVEIGRLDLVEMRRTAARVFETECGKGTYVRSLARDMGRDLGCFGHVSELRRVVVGPFTAEDFVTVAGTRSRALGEAGQRRERRPADGLRRDRRLIVDTAAALECLPQVAITDDAARGSGSAIRSSCAAAMRRSRPTEACATARGRAGRDRRDRGRHVPAEAGVRRLSAEPR